MENPRNKTIFTPGLIVFVVILFFGFSLVRNVIKISEANKKIAEAKSRVEKLKRENEELERRLSEVTSEAYVEKQIRDKLGLAKEGEIVVVLPDKEKLAKLVPAIEEEEDTLPDPTWRKWVHLFGL